MAKVMAVASGGGHWVQLQRLRPAFEDAQIEWVSTEPEYAATVSGRFHVVRDANLWDKWGLLLMFLQMAWLMLRVRPHLVVTTGAAPGFAAIVFGRMFRAKTVWIDSIANGEALSNSGAKARRWADIWLTQWEHLAGPDGPTYWGAVI